jgi:hypothetical protein
VVSLGHIILIPRQPVFALSPLNAAYLSKEATNTNFSLWFGATGFIFDHVH